MSVMTAEKFPVELNDGYDLDELRDRFRSAKPFPSICIDNFLRPEFVNEVCQTFPSYEESKRLGRGFNAVNEAGKVQITDSSLFSEPLQRLHNMLSSSLFLNALEHISGISGLVADKELVGGGLHQTGPRGRLDVHVDFNYIKARRLHRRLNILVFFNEEWRDDWGGKLELWDEKVKTRYHSFAPILNRCVIFETSDISYHGVTAVTCPDNVARRSFAAYYYTEAKDVDLDHEFHSTVFRARPDEKFKNYVLMPAERTFRWVLVQKNRLKSGLKKMIK